MRATPDSSPRCYPRVLTIAGSDSGGGAGIQADLKTFSALGCYGMSAITALTAQNTVGVRAIHGVPTSFLREQIAAVVEDMGVDAVKIGMLFSPASVAAVVWAIDRYRLRNIVLDPVMMSTTGQALMQGAAVRLVVAELLPRVTLVTPNLDEAGGLLHRTVRSEADMVPACADLLALGASAVLLKGGHLPGDWLTDLLAVPGQAPTAWLRLQGSRIPTANFHGTGCTLSAAIAAHLALGWALPDAIEAAHHYLRAALLAGSDVQLGQGHGPLNHGHAPVPWHKQLKTEV